MDTKTMAKAKSLADLAAIKAAQSAVDETMQKLEKSMDRNNKMMKRNRRKAMRWMDRQNWPWTQRKQTPISIFSLGTLLVGIGLGAVATYFLSTLRSGGEATPVLEQAQRKANETLDEFRERASRLAGAPQDDVRRDRYSGGGYSTAGKSGGAMEQTGPTYQAYSGPGDRDIPQPEWQQLFENLTRQHGGERVTVEIEDGGEKRTIVEDQPLMYFSFDTESAFNVRVVVGGGPGSNFAHVVDDVNRVELMVGDNYVEDGLRIRGRGGATTVRFGASKSA